MPYEMLPPGKYIAQLAVPAEGATSITITPFTDRDGNDLGGLVCNMVLDLHDEAGNYVRTAYCENWRGVTLALRKPTPKCPDGLLPFNWDRLVQIFGLQSRAEVLDLERLAADPTRGAAIMAARFELVCRHESYSAKDAHGMATGETKVAERYDIRPLGYVEGGGGFRDKHSAQAATLNRFRTLIMASKAPVQVAQTAPVAAPAPTVAPAAMPARPAMPQRSPVPAAQSAPATPPASVIEAANAAHAITPEDLWNEACKRWGAEAETKVYAAMDLVKSAAGKNIDELSPEEAFLVGCNIDIGLLPF